MTAKFKAHRYYYLILAGMQVLGFVLVLLANGDKQLQFSYVVLSTTFYIIWALAHHYVHHELHTKVVVEYILMGAVGISVMYFFLQ